MVASGGGRVCLDLAEATPAEAARGMALSRTLGWAEGSGVFPSSLGVAAAPAEGGFAAEPEREAAPSA